MSTTRRIILSPNVARPAAPYSHGVLVDNVLYVSGQIGRNTEREIVDGFAGQARQALENMGHILREAGGDFKDVVKVTVLLSDINNFTIMNSIYSEYFTQDLPARAAYQVVVLPKNTLIHIDAVAVLDIPEKVVDLDALV